MDEKKLHNRPQEGAGLLKTPERDGELPKEALEQVAGGSLWYATETRLEIEEVAF